MDVEVGVIYTYERELLARLTPGLCRSAPGLRMRLLLIDNASADGPPPLPPAFDDVRIVRNERPLGYAANLNRILEVSEAPYVLALNTDMEFDPAAQCVTRMVQFMESHPCCGAAGCRLYLGSGEYAHPARRFPTLGSIAARRLPGGSRLRSALDQHLYQERDPASDFQCDWLSGAFLMLRREAVQQTGQFDEGYGKYFEDVDYCRRLSRAGWQVWHCGDAWCFHLEQRASLRLLSRDAFLHGRAYLKWLWKWRGQAA